MEARQIRVQYMALAQLAKLGDDENPKDHDIAGILESIERFGFTEPLTLNEHTGRVLAGHGRIEGLVQRKEQGKPPPDRIKLQRGDWHVPVLRGVSLKDRDEQRAYILAVNRLTERGGWSLPKLSTMLQGMLTRKVPIAGIGYSRREIDRIVARGARVGTREVTVPQLPKESRVKLGEVWELGAHRLACGDARDASMWERLCAGERADLLHADPPYGMGKSFLFDNLQAQKLDQFQMDWWNAARPCLTDNASAYVWGSAEDLWRWWFLWFLPACTRAQQAVTFNNEIVWDKEFGNGQGTAAIRSFPMLTERALFFALGRQGYGNKNQDRYWEGWEELRGYLEGEAVAAQLDSKRTKELTGTNMHAHWFGKSQWTLIAEKHYATLHKATGRFNKPYEKLAKRQSQLLEQFNEWLEHERSFFDGTHDPNLADVWRFTRVEGAERLGHDTPKPIAMMVRVLRSSLRTGGLVLVPFGGTGSELMAAEQTGRRCYGMDLDPLWCEVELQRWEGFTGKTARRLESIAAE